MRYLAVWYLLSIREDRLGCVSLYMSLRVAHVSRSEMKKKGGLTWTHDKARKDLRSMPPCGPIPVSGAPHRMHRLKRSLVSKVQQVLNLTTGLHSRVTEGTLRHPAAPTRSKVRRKSRSSFALFFEPLPLCSRQKYRYRSLSAPFASVYPCLRGRLAGD